MEQGFGNQLSKQAATALIVVVGVSWAIGALSLGLYQYAFNSDNAIDPKIHEQLTKDIVTQRKELDRLYKLKGNIADTLKYKYQAEILFSNVIIDPENIDNASEEINLSVLIPISKEFYHSTKDSTVIKTNTKTVGEPIQYLNISKLKLLKRSRYEIN